MFLETKKTGEAHIKLEPWRQLLLEGADLIERHGHCKHKLRDMSGALCFVAAISHGADVPGAYVTARSMMSRALGGQHPVDWNNAPEITGADVVAKMREVANTY